MKNIFSLIVLLFSVISFGQTPFGCGNDGFYQVISGEIKTYDPITRTHSAPYHSFESFDVVGFNVVDNYLYAINKSDKHLLRIGEEFVFDLGEVISESGVVFKGSRVADIDSEGNLWVFQNSTKNKFHKVIEVQNYNGTTNPTFEEVYTDKSLSMSCSDIVFIKGTLYGGGNDSLYKWDISTDVVSMTSNPVCNLPNSISEMTYVDRTSQLYLSDIKGLLYVLEEYKTNNIKVLLLDTTSKSNSIQNDL